MMDSQSPLEQETQKALDPNVYRTEEDDEDEIDRRIRRADERLRRLTIVGAPEFNNDFLCEDTLTVEGGYDTGYAVNYVDCGAAASNESGGGPNTGACCADDGTCSITTEADCTGTYQGDGTECDPNPCPQPGACCVDESCTIELEADCSGVFQGEGTVCEPNPCVPPCDTCYFTDDFGNHWLTKIVSSSGSVSCADPDPLGFTGSYSGTATLDCTSGSFVETCSGSGDDCRGLPDVLTLHLGSCWWFLGGSAANQAPFYPVSCGLFDDGCIFTWEALTHDCSGTCIGGCTDPCVGSFSITVEYSNPCTL